MLIVEEEDNGSLFEIFVLAKLSIKFASTTYCSLLPERLQKDGSYF